MCESDVTVDHQFAFSVRAAESGWRERPPQTSAPAGDRAGGSVPHDPHR